MSCSNIILFIIGFSPNLFILFVVPRLGYYLLSITGSFRQKTTVPLKFKVSISILVLKMSLKTIFGKIAIFLPQIPKY